MGGVGSPGLTASPIAIGLGLATPGVQYSTPLSKLQQGLATPGVQYSTPLSKLQQGAGHVEVTNTPRVRLHAMVC